MITRQLLYPLHNKGEITGNRHTMRNPKHVAFIWTKPSRMPAGVRPSRPLIGRDEYRGAVLRIAIAATWQFQRDDLTPC